MNSEINLDFLERYWALPRSVREAVREAYALWVTDPSHKSLHFKKVSAHLPLWSVRVRGGYRVVGIFEDDTVVWFFVGTHAEYDRLLGKGGDAARKSAVGKSRRRGGG